MAAKDLNLPISENNHELHDLPSRYLERQLPRGATPFTVQVRHVVEALLGTGTCDHRQVANALYMHPRTLQRRLREEGTTFDTIKDDVRRDLAERYLSQPDLPLTQVSALLDYSEQSAWAEAAAAGSKPPRRASATISRPRRPRPETPHDTSQARRPQRPRRRCAACGDGQSREPGHVSSYRTINLPAQKPTILRFIVVSFVMPGRPGPSRYRPVRSRCLHPGQQQGRRWPSSSSSWVRRMRRFRVVSCLASSTQQMNSFRARGVMSFQA